MGTIREYLGIKIFAKIFLSFNYDSHENYTRLFSLYRGWIIGGSEENVEIFHVELQYQEIF